MRTQSRGNGRHNRSSSDSDLGQGRGREYGPYRTTDYGTILDRFAKYFIAEGRKGLAPEVVGEVVYRALTAAEPNVRDAVVGKKLQDWTLPRLLPSGWSIG